MMDTQVQACETGLICLVCGKIIQHRNHMRRHMNDLHLAAQEYHCPLCQKTFPARSNFYSHVHVKHPDWKGVSIDSFRMSK
jgi:uncharacterized C2H2 Zn-finger protein